MKSPHLLLFLLCAIGVAQAYDPLADETETDFVPSTESWQEEAVTVPEGFDANDLQSFKPSSSSDRFDYGIERRSLHTGNDGVTRFVVVIRSRQGSVNSSYEGFRCGHREYKVYAYGNGQGLTPMPGNEWQAIPRRAGDFRAFLYEDLICNLTLGQPNSPDAILHAMSNGSKVRTPFFNGTKE